MISTEKIVRPDAKGRIGIGAFIEEGLSGFRVSVDNHHRIILEPLIEKPRHPKSKTTLGEFLASNKKPVLTEAELSAFAEDIAKARPPTSIPRNPWDL